VTEKLHINVTRALDRMRDLKLAEELERLAWIERVRARNASRLAPASAGWARKMALNLTVRATLFALALVFVVGCGGRSEEDAPVVECIEQEWTPEWCDARSAKQFVVVCDGGERGELGTDGVWSGAPYAACAPAELATDVMAWCCWGRSGQ
jgi:hypothetical protein